MTVTSESPEPDQSERTAAGPAQGRRAMRWPALAMVVGVAALTLAGCVGNTDPATNVSDTGAKLNAHGHTNNGPAYWWWEYAASASDLGTDSDVEDCGDNTRCGPASASSDVPLRTNVAGLKPETT